MKKSQFIELVAERAEMSKAAAARVVDAIFDTAGGAISEAVRTAGQLSIPGFGKFSSKTRAAREGRNPRTGAVIQIPERTTVGFTPGKGLRDTMSGGGTGRGAAKKSSAARKSRTAGTARKAAGAAATGERTPARKTATAKKSGTAAKSTPAAGSTAKKAGGTKSAKK